MAHKYIASAVKIVANAIVILAFGLLAYASYLNYRNTGSLNWLGLIIINSLFVAMYVAKRDAVSITSSPYLWLLAFAATCAPLALRPAEAPAFALLGKIIQFFGLCGVVGSLLSLRRSFGIVPANRGIC